MHVGFVSQYVYPHDEEIRIAKCAATLVGAGHRVTVFCRAEAASPRVELAEGLEVRRFRVLRSSSRLQRAVTSTFPFNPLWVLWLWRAFRRGRVEIVVVRNLRLAFATLVAARLARVRAVMDLGENHPALVAAVGKQRWAHYVTRNPALVGWLERACVRRADHVWVVEEGNRRRLMAFRRARGDRDWVTVVRNVPLLEDSEYGARRAADHPRDGRGDLRLVYLGILDNLRGLEVVVAAIGVLAATGDPVELVIVGDGPERGRLEVLARAIGIGDRVAFRGWLKGPAREAELEAADVGLIPHRVCQLTETTQPNKLYDYMLAGLPVLSTPLGPVREILEGVRCGVVVPLSPDAIAAAVRVLRADPGGRQAMGARGRRAVLDRYNWKVESKEVLATLSALVAS